MFLYGFLSVIVSDITIPLSHGHSYVAVGITIVFLLIPYFAAIKLYFKLKKAEQDAAANP